MSTIEQADGRYKCSLCGLLADSTELIEYHLKARHGVDIIRTNLSRADLMRRLSRYGRNPYKIPPEIMRDLLTERVGEKYKCVICGSVCTSENVEKHLESHLKVGLVSVQCPDGELLFKIVHVVREISEPSREPKISQIDLTLLSESVQSRPAASNEIAIRVRELKSKIVLEFPENLAKWTVYSGKQALKVGKSGKIRIKKSSPVGKDISRAISEGKEVVLVGNEVKLREVKTMKGEAEEERKDELKLLYELADRCDNWMANLPEGYEGLRERIRRLFNEIILCVSSIEKGGENPFIVSSHASLSEVKRLVELCERGAAEVEDVTIEDERALVKIRYVDDLPFGILKEIREKGYWQVNSEDDAKLALELSSTGPFKLALIPSAYEPLWFKKFYEPRSPNPSQVYHSVSKKIEECKQLGIGGRILRLLEKLKEDLRGNV